jgi:hypothetical protein
MNTTDEDELMEESSAEFWGERTDENVGLLDDFCWQLAVWICEGQYRHAVTYTDQHAPPERNDGWPCDACYETAIWGFLADAFRVFGREAYCAGAEGDSKQAAAEQAIMGIGKLAQDGMAIDKLLDGLKQGSI